MLSNYPVSPILASTDLERSKKFYGEELGLEEAPEKMEGLLMYKCGEGSVLVIYERGPFSPSETTNAGFNVQNIEELVKELTDKGAAFEQYDMEQLKTDENGIATMGNVKSAWLKDPDGNIIALNQM